MAVEDTVSPRVLRKMVYAGVSAVSYDAGGQDLVQLAGLSITDERVRRACQRVGEERIDHHQRLQEAYEQKPLPEQSYGAPAGVTIPEIACVMADGGRYQLLDRSEATSRRRSARKGEHWKESRIGLLANMCGERHASDPQPILPPELRYEAMADTLAEIGKTGTKVVSESESDAEVETELTSDSPSDGLVGPELVARSVVASRQNWEEFGRLLASQAWYQGFAAAQRKVFVSDGSATIEKLQQTHFSHYTSVLDILHALAYGLAAARAVTNHEDAAREKYDAWASKIWEGNVDDVIDELIAYGTKFGEPPPDAKATILVRSSV